MTSCNALTFGPVDAFINNHIKTTGLNVYVFDFSLDYRVSTSKF